MASVHAASCLAALLSLVGGGCALPAREANFRSADPQERATAIARAAVANDAASIPALIESLDDPDPALRMLSIAALERITGETLGYEATAPQPERERAVRRWVEWERARRGG